MSFLSYHKKLANHYATKTHNSKTKQSWIKNKTLCDYHFNLEKAYEHGHRKFDKSFRRFTFSQANIRAKKLTNL